MEGRVQRNPVYDWKDFRLKSLNRSIQKSCAVTRSCIAIHPE